MVAACLVVRSDRSLAPDRISPVAVLRAPGGGAQLADNVAQLFGHRVGIGLEAGESAADNRPRRGG